MVEESDVIIVGAGIIGLATAWEVARRRPDSRILVLERESRLSIHQTGTNSGVIHAGVYYAPGSLKARLTKRGRDLLFPFLDTHHIPYRLSGKLIVASSQEELPRLDTLYQNALANQVPGIRRISPEAIHEIEPHVEGVGAIHSPATGIIYFPDVAEKLDELLTARGHGIRTGISVEHLLREPEHVRILTRQGDFLARQVIIAAGIQTDRLAEAAGYRLEARMLPFRGDYLVLSDAKNPWIRSLVYPVPDRNLPFLGVHFTRRLKDDAVWIGPNAVLAFDRMHAHRGAWNTKDAIAALSFAGTWRLLARYWRTGIDEWYRDHLARAYLHLARRYVPGLQPRDVRWGPSGIRAQLVDTQGTLLDDFRFLGDDRLLFVLNAPSPGATSSLAIAEHLVETGAQQFGWTLAPPAL